LHQLQQDAAGKVHLGLDLQGGSSFLVEMDTNQLSRAEEKQTALENAVEVLRKRVDNLGVAEPLLQPQGTRSILIQLPGLSESAKQNARETIEKAAFLEFRMVHENSDEMLASGIIDPGYEVLRMEIKQPDGSKGVASYLVNKKAELTGKHLKRANVTRQPLTNEPEIAFELDSEGAKIFEDLTRKYSPKGSKYYHLAIVLDGVLYSAPRINEPIPNGHGQISGSFDQKEAQNLAYILENPLEAPVKVVDERSVDPSLGKDAIRSGVTAAIVGTAAVAAFMAIYYLLAGLVANIALILNIVILMGVMCSIGTTLTLPGIAGFILTIGAAVDANVLINERIREEQRRGRKILDAIETGYREAMRAIFDANITHVIAASIMAYFGSGPVRGFAVVLLIGVVTSVFTAVYFTRMLVALWVKRTRPRVLNI
jgi:protein-export membrane protein SecD